MCPQEQQSQPQQTQSPPLQQPSQTGFGFGSTMQHDAYQRTLEYVQNCQSWAENTDTPPVTTTPAANIVINEMSTSLSSLLEETRYFNNSAL